MRVAYGKGAKIIFPVDPSLVPARQGLGWIRGRVRDAQRRPVANAQITAISSTGESVRTACDAAGEYEIPELAPGLYRLRVRVREGYPHEAAAKVERGKETYLAVDLP